MGPTTDGGVMNTDNHSSDTGEPTGQGDGTAVHQAPVITPLGTLAELTLGAGPGASDGFDGFGGS